MKRKVAIITLGCPKNQVDSEVLAGELRRHGAVLTADPEKADDICINTCGFIREAKQESIDAILEAVRIRDKAGRSRAVRPRVVVWGCLSERYRDALPLEIPEADAYFGVEPFRALGRYIIGTRYRWSEAGRCGRVLSTPPHTAYLKIADGCDHACSFCAIPLFKGKYRSRPQAGLVREAESLAARGVKELILIAQDTTAYGRDLGGKASLARLLKRLVRIEGIEWIRILYGHPAHVDDALIDAMAAEPKVCKYLDLPLQHISDPLLKAMGRGMTKADVIRLIENLRALVPGLTLRTAFITGFPGETETRFEELARFVREVRFERMGVFTFSLEEGTRAFALRPAVPSATAKRRARVLMRIQKSLSAEYHRSLEGKVIPVLVDGTDRRRRLCVGRTPGDAPEIDATVWVRGKAGPGRIVPVRIDGSSAYDLTGTVVPPAAGRPRRKHRRSDPAGRD
ncbi:30S ribosomal protein S12 methylthiotransferase RimO [bacterium]|nr:30S ribosomal protein S12 methylthiotransferase RimO [bacterium]